MRNLSLYGMFATLSLDLVNKITKVEERASKILSEILVTVTERVSIDIWKFLWSL